MELNNKVKELEDEVKVLKAEIRNVLLDIREVILDKTNPLSEEHESAFLRMDLNTTSRAMAAETAGRAAADAANQAEASDSGQPDDAPDATAPDDAPDASAADDAPADTAADDPAASSKGKGSRKGKKGKEAAKTKAATPEKAPEAPVEIPSIYRASGTIPAGALGLAAWVVDAMKAIGPQQLDRVITIHRLCGNLSPNVSEALAHLQEIIRTSEGEDPAWLHVLQDLDRLASS